MSDNELISTNTNIIDYLQENKSNHSENLESEETESEQEKTTENKEKITTAYIAKITKFTGEDNDTSPQEWLDKVQKAEDFIAGLKNKLIKKVCPHAPEDLATVIKHAKNYEMAMEEANHTKLVNLAIGKTSSAAEKKIDQLTKKDTGNKIVGNYKETNKTGIINITLYHNNLTTNLYHQPRPQNQNIPARKLVQQNQFTPQNQYQNNNNRINPNNQPNHYYTQSSYLTMPKGLDFQQTALSESEIAAPTSNPSNNTISPVQIAQNTNLSDIFPFEFETNESPFLLSNAAVNEQKAITAMYTKATIEGKPIQLILDSGSAESIITYQLIQQLNRNVDRPAQTVIVIADSIKKTPIGEINNFPFTIDGITIPVKVLVMDKLKISYQGQYIIVSATCGTFNKWSEKALVFEFEKKKEMPFTETYMPLRSTFNWAEKTEQEIFEESKE
ncbi:hypothetical protein G9A89_023743 [Geosiphon pyriformis]|nr:hypothetical protein G9A89_023743 [Geosiphon pyriformis]